MISTEFLEYLPQEVKDALNVFSEEELGMLSAYLDTDGTFVGIGFTDEKTGLFTRWADPEKLAAIEILEKRLLWELQQMQQERERQVNGYFTLGS